jgi:hypothetical protein
MVMRSLNEIVDLGGEKMSIADAVKRGLLVPRYSGSFSDPPSADGRKAYFADLPGQRAGFEISLEDFIKIGGVIE